MMAHHRASRVARLIRRYPAASIGLVFGGIVQYLADHQWSLAGRTQLVIWAVVGIAVAAGGRISAVRRILDGLHRGYSGVYVIYGLDPWADYATETCIYIGETGQKSWIDRDGKPRDPRLEEHGVGFNGPHGSGLNRWGKPFKPWSDTVTRWHYAYESHRSFTFLRMRREYRLIRRMRPIYNVEYNLDNPWRIIPAEQVAQRLDRDNWRVAG